MSSKYVLTYFNARGRAETIRLAFAVAGVAYEDKRIQGQNWPELKPQTPWGHIPILAVEGKGIIGQSITIARFVAREHGLGGKSSWESGIVDSIVDSITEVREKSYEVHFEKDEAKKKQLQAGFKDTIAPSLKGLEKILTSNQDGAGFFVGTEITLADIHFFTIFESVRGAAPTLLDDYPKLKALFARLETYPKIADYLKTRPQTAF